MDWQMGAGELARAHKASCFKSLFPFNGKGWGELRRCAPFARAIRQAIAIDPQDKETCINYAAFLKVNKLDTAREDFLGCLKKLGVDTDGWR